MQVSARLHMFGVHERYKTFRQPFSLMPYFGWMFRTSLSDLTLREVARQAVDFRRWDIYLIFQASRIFSWIHRKTKRLLRGFLSREAEYRLKKRVYANTPNRIV
jgi:hypothetical protein